MPLLKRLLKYCLLGGVLLGVMGASALAVLFWLIWPTLPSVEHLRDTRLQVPLSVHTSDGLLMAQFGETRRYPVKLAEVPLPVRQAFIAVEDARFYEHPGIDVIGIARAVWLLATTSDRRVPGGSTITQQVARMFFLSPEYSYTRKITEIFLALKMERELSKDEILELYLNKSFFGNRAYGIAAAAEFYYGKPLTELSLQEGAMLASIPKFPSSGNPVVNPVRARERRDYVLGRMLEEGFIGADQHAFAVAQPDLAEPHEPPVEVDAPWLAEMVRQDAVDRFGELALTDGHRVRTTIVGRLQQAANSAVHAGLLEYDHRHGWRGAEARVEPDTGTDTSRALAGRREIGGLLPALVTASSEASASLLLEDGRTIEIPLGDLEWARTHISEYERGPPVRRASDVLRPGDVVRVVPGEDGAWRLAQLPAAQSALVAIDYRSGAIRALTGGFSFSLNKFNRVTQSQRQPGSSFKPFVYASAFERGFTPASIVLDAPVVFNDSGSGKSWRPQNDNQSFAGPMRLREAMVTSRNLVSVRVLDAVGVSFARRYIENFGFSPESLPANLSLALGTNAAPPLAMARGYAVFANGGYLISPHFIEQIEDRDGNVLFEMIPEVACDRCDNGAAANAPDAGEDAFDLGPASSAPPEEAADAVDDSTLAAADIGEPQQTTPAPRAIDERTAYLVNSLLRDVVRRGTGRAAAALGRADVGGKTGTTNDHRDGWFSGFGGPLVVTAWMGMDDFSSLGHREFASRTALPVWVDFMKVALEGEPERLPALPSGVATALIDPDTGRLVPPGTPGAISEIFRVEDLSRLERQPVVDERTEQREAFDIF